SAANARPKPADRPLMAVNGLMFVLQLRCRAHRALRITPIWATSVSGPFRGASNRRDGRHTRGRLIRESETRTSGPAGDSGGVHPVQVQGCRPPKDAGPARQVDQARGVDAAEIREG